LQQLLRSGLKQLGFALDEPAVENLLIYAGELQKWNRRINLIARNTSPADVIEKHFLDSLTLLPFFESSGAKRETLLDVGTGAGFPGLVLATALPDLQVILVEPRLKRVSFLRHIIRTLSLENVEVIEDRLESVPELCTGNINYVTSRAVAEPSIFLPMVAPFLARGARALLMLGREQALQWGSDAPVAGMILEQKKNFTLPVSGAERTVCIVRGNIHKPDAGFVKS